MARSALKRSRAFARLVQIAKNGKDRDSIEAIKMLAVLGYTTSILTGQNSGHGGGGLPLPPAADEDDQVVVYLPANGREQKAESA